VLLLLLLSLEMEEKVGMDPDSEDPIQYIFLVQSTYLRNDENFG
jgi:hypothetical protein